MAHRTDSIGRFQPCASFGFFQIGHLPFTKITFVDTCQKTVSTHAPQFRSNLFYSEINSNHVCQRLIKSLFPNKHFLNLPFLPLDKLYKYLRLLPCQHFYCSVLLASPSAQELICSAAAVANQNTLLGFQLQESFPQQWLPSLKSPRYVSFHHSLF